MKSLNTYISEKLVINKNYKLDEYQCIKPNKEGICLEIVIPTTNGNFSRIALYERLYHKKIDRIISCGSEYVKNTKGYYYSWHSEQYHGKWIWFLLFGDDAKLFLNTLLNDVKQKMDITEFIGSSRFAKKGAFECKNDYNDFYTKEDIKELISDII